MVHARLHACCAYACMHACDVCCHSTLFAASTAQAGLLALTSTMLRKPVHTRVFSSSHPMPPAPTHSTLAAAICKPWGAELGRLFNAPHTSWIRPKLSHSLAVGANNVMLATSCEQRHGSDAMLARRCMASSSASQAMQAMPCKRCSAGGAMQAASCK
eukprot:365482-Chlamydomonas_euryale.AAC.6